jgi:hypothetical protein
MPDRIVVTTPIGELRCETHDDPSCPGLAVYWNKRRIAVIEPSTLAGAPTFYPRVLIWSTDDKSPTHAVAVFPEYGE